MSNPADLAALAAEPRPSMVEADGRHLTPLAEDDQAMPWRSPSPRPFRNDRWLELQQMLSDDKVEPTRAERRNRARPSYDFGPLAAQFGAKSPLPKASAIRALDREAARPDTNRVPSHELPADTDDDWRVISMGLTAEQWLKAKEHRAAYHADRTAAIAAPLDLDHTEPPTAAAAGRPYWTRPDEPPPLRVARLVLTRTVLTAAPPRLPCRLGSLATVPRAA